MLNHSCSNGATNALDSVATDVIMLVFIPVFCLVGLVLNIFTLLVFRKDTLLPSWQNYMKAKAVLDIITLIVVFPVGLTRCSICIYPNSTFTRAVKTYEIYVYEPVNDFSVASSVTVTAAVTVKRLLALRNIKLLTLPTSLVSLSSIIIGTIVFAHVCLSVPYFFVWQLSPEGLKEYTKFGLSPSYVVFSWTRITLAKFIPTGIILVVNCALVHEVCKASHKRRQIATELRRDSLNNKMINKTQFRLTVTFLGIGLCTAVTHIPEAFTHSGIFESINGLCSRYTDSYKILRLACLILEMIDSAADFIIYYLCIEQFREACKEMCCCRKTCTQTAPIQSLS